jgi:homospermidine synthase
MKQIKFLFIGCGAVGKAIIEIWQLEKLYKNNKIVIIEPEDLPEWIFNFHTRIKHIKKELDQKNSKKLLKDLDENTFVIDVSVSTDCIMIIDEVIKAKSFYINTSVENWEDVELEKEHLSKKYDEFKKNTLYHRELMIKNKISKSTILINEGANPGIVSSMTLKALDEVAKSKGIQLKDGSYADLAKKLKLRTVHISEIDTQKTEIKPDPEVFYNTWSSLGAQAEFGDYVMLGFGTHEKESKDLIKPNEGDGHVRFMAEHACNVWRESICPNDKGEPLKYEGMLIPHAEASSISLFLTTKDKSYRPTVHYVYHPSDICFKSTDFFKENKYVPLPYWHVLNLEDVTEGYDILGVTLFFENGEVYFYHMCQSLEDVKKLGFKYSNPTVIQVAGVMITSIKYILKHKKMGIIEPEELPHKSMIEQAQPYIGKIINSFVDKSKIINYEKDSL